VLKVAGDLEKLHHAASSARTVDGDLVVVAILDQAELLPLVIKDAAKEHADAPLWLYVPTNLYLGNLDEHLVVRAVDLRTV